MADCSPTRARWPRSNLVKCFGCSNAVVLFNSDVSTPSPPQEINEKISGLNPKMPLKSLSFLLSVTEPISIKLQRYKQFAALICQLLEVSTYVLFTLLFSCFLFLKHKCNDVAFVLTSSPPPIINHATVVTRLPHYHNFV